MDLHQIYNYRETGIELQAEIDLQLASRTPEEIQADQKKTEEQLESLHKAFLADEESTHSYQKKFSKEKERQFLHYAELLREYAETQDGCLEVSIQNGIGKILLVCNAIFHTSDAIDKSRFLFALLFLKYKSTTIYAEENSVCLSIVVNLQDTLKS